jgi:hypothetical protein
VLFFTKVIKLGDGDRSEEVEGVEHRWNQHGLGGNNLEGISTTPVVKVVAIAEETHQVSDDGDFGHQILERNNKKYKERIKKIIFK